MLTSGAPRRRHNLEKVQPLVQALCAKHGVAYHSQPFWAVMAAVMRDFGALSEAMLRPDEILG